MIAKYHLKNQDACGYTTVIQKDLSNGAVRDAIILDRASKKHFDA
jgi:hypothetical protein